MIIVGEDATWRGDGTNQSTTIFLLQQHKSQKPFFMRMGTLRSKGRCASNAIAVLAKSNCLAHCYPLQSVKKDPQSVSKSIFLLLYARDRGQE